MSERKRVKMISDENYNPKYSEDLPFCYDIVGEPQLNDENSGIVTTANFQWVSKI